jgi:methylated-DNA-[protein]-cysteine S-methyltransferase
MIITRLNTPPGPLDVYVVDGKLVALGFDIQTESLRARVKARFRDQAFVEGESEPAARVRDYFGGDLQALETLAVDPKGTPFQQRVWTALRKIPVGKTVSYGELARSIGQPTAVRAVARANALNPIALVIPCHRVIGSDGTLTGYAGGLPRKKWLLEFEGQALGS